MGVLLAGVFETATGPRVRLEVFGEALCPFTSKFLRNQLSQLLLVPDLLDKGILPSPNQHSRQIILFSVDLEYYPFGNAECQPLPNGDYA